MKKIITMKKISTLILSLFSTAIFAQEKIRLDEVEPQPTVTLEQKIGQMLMLGVGSVTSVDANNPVVKAIQKGYVGGILLFERNISPENSKKKLAQLTADLQSYASVPLLISIDQEGGKVNRLKEKYGFPKSVTAKYLGNVNDTCITRQYADSTASTLQKMGINLNFAPTVDIHQDTNPVIGKFERAYSTNTETIVKQATQVIEAHRQYGIMTALKHFPGHGSSRADTHVGVADVTPYWSENEVTPYVEMLRNNEVDGVLVAHVVNEKLDPEGNPASLSKKIVTDYLRGTLGYNGIVYTDDMQMHAITEHYGVRESIKKAILAGDDVLVFSNAIPTKGRKDVAATEMIDMIVDMVQKGEISEERINESYYRIIAFKKNLKNNKTAKL